MDEVCAYCGRKIEGRDYWINNDGPYCFGCYDEITDEGLQDLEERDKED